MNDLGGLTNFWLSTFGQTVPSILRWDFNQRWVRFHSLPGSKRYPDNEDELSILLGRHGAILDALVITDEPLSLISSGYSDSPSPVRDNEHLRRLDPEARPWWTIPPEPDDDSCFRHLFVSSWTWSPGIFDPLIRLVAAEEIADLYIVSQASSWVLHPYDGGCDVILADTAARDSLRQAFPEWLSPHESGL